MGNIWHLDRLVSEDEDHPRWFIANDRRTTVAIIVYSPANNHAENQESFCDFVDHIFEQIFISMGENSMTSTLRHLWAIPPHWCWRKSGKFEAVSALKKIHSLMEWRDERNTNSSKGICCIHPDRRLPRVPLNIDIAWFVQMRKSTSWTFIFRSSPENSALTSIDIFGKEWQQI